MPDGSKAGIEYDPVLATDDIYTLGQAALAGLGIALLPRNLCGRAVREGRLARLLPTILSPRINSTRFSVARGLVPAVRAFLDFLSGSELPLRTREWEDGYPSGPTGSDHELELEARRPHRYRCSRPIKEQMANRLHQRHRSPMADMSWIAHCPI